MTKKSKKPRDGSTYRSARRALARDIRKKRRAMGAPITFNQAWTQFSLRSHAATVTPENVDLRRVNPSKHPGANPLHNPEGRQTFEVPTFDRATDKVVMTKVKGPRNPSRWVPHIGAKQRGRAA